MQVIEKTPIRIENDQWWETATDEQKQAHREALSQVKQWFKDYTFRVRELMRIHRKKKQHGYESLTQEEKDLEANFFSWRDCWEHRHRHIAYSLYRGRTRSQIERPSISNLPNESRIQEYLDEYKKTLRPDPS